MPYGEKLKSIKKERNLTNKQIHEMCDVSLPTVTRMFDEDSQGGQFETYVSFARGLGFSLDELAGLKQPDEQPIPSPIIETISSHAELLREKDERIQELKEQNEKLQTAFNELKIKDEKTIVMLEKEKQDIRHEKRKTTSALICVVLILLGLGLVLVVGLLIDLLNGDIGKFRY